MKKHFVIIGLAALSLSSCVTLGKYEALEATNNAIKKEHNVTRQELFDLKEEYATLQRQFQAQTTEYTDLQALKLNLDDTITLLRHQVGNMQLGVDTLIENYTQKIDGQNRSLAQAQAQLAARTQELNDKEKAFAAKRSEFEKKYNDLVQKEAATQKALKAKEQELETVRKSVAKALVGFKDKGLNVEVKDSKVYVSMESKLMFASGSWTVSKEGQEAIMGLAKVLEENPDLTIMVEGHTDNDAYKGSTAVKDNWDLSVMRATAIVKLLLKYGPKIDPANIEASGHSEYAPKVENSSAANKAINRRTEIILTPDLDALMKSLSK